MQIQIEILSVAAPVFVATARGGYNTMEIAFKKDGKIEGKKLVDFNNKAVFETLKNAVAKDTFNVTLDKGPNDKYWNWTAIAKGGTAQADNPGQGVQAIMPEVSKSVGRVTGSNYETPEERAIKQRYIVRQSSVSNALTLITHNSPKGNVDVEAVIATAEKFEDYVYNGSKHSKATKAIQELSDLVDDIPV